jgi:hypothetical protein
MLLKLTNASEGFEGDILIDVGQIVSVYSTKIKETNEIKTFVYCGQVGTWMVEESVDFIYNKLNN